ncbi:aromatic hydrocarbon degradation protein [Parasulfuritortus cantonensis]|uniref:Aromatic hydrocarbon degradation protein n=1 Tax=Parasulfuritortus cantonensis TaxID=2528202 RepID=A0A4V2NVV2_9PROT|nr:outer membrane protein transport protein [Parasulfuritortus cantonensis]TCJ14912.1 aromatic hydrocarbon degradation protein [Parasulfuritortus cantonensis]
MTHAIFKPRPATAVLGALTLLCAASAQATNGTMPHGYGIKAQGMGGVAIALPQDGLAAANNPAGMAFVGNRLDLGLAVVMPKPEASFGGVQYDGDGDKAIPIPEFGYNRVLDDRQSVGVSVYGNGVSTKYDTSILGGPGSGDDGAQLTQIIASPTYAYRITPRQAIGISADLAYQRFRVQGVPDSTGVEGQGYDSSTGVGFKVGWLGQVSEQLTLGAMYSSRVRMGKLDKYRNLLANSGQFDVPERYGVGFAWRPTQDLTIAGDVLRINWGDIDSLGNALTDAEPGFGWRNQTVSRLGVAWQARPDLVLRTGYSHGTQIVSSDSATLDYLAPVTPQRHLSLGATWTLDAQNEISFVYARAFGSKVDGTGPSTGVSVDMAQHWVGVAWGRQL